MENLPEQALELAVVYFGYADIVSRLGSRHDEGGWVGAVGWPAADRGWRGPMLCRERLDPEWHYKDRLKEVGKWW